ncbi:hypothetical protein IWQ62_004916 [Dispira parvispora]|uniref:Galactose oxidase n=1 Tax=Dispira parvispora TaxID=1520584 RepID=A0A9W8ARS3_9FUNG|nr:hypothetical protein IWQ62_004916 [Dispira parvispora]
MHPQRRSTVSPGPDLPSWNHTSTWLSVPRGRMAVATMDQWAIFAGGEHSDGSPSDVVDIYDYHGNQWTTEKLSSPRRLLAGASLNNRYALFAGGVESPSGKYSDVVDIYDVQTRQWLPPGKLSTPRAIITTVVLGNRALFLGGQTDTDPQRGMVPSTAVDIVDDQLIWTHRQLSSKVGLPPLPFAPVAAPAYTTSPAVAVITGGYFFSSPQMQRPVQYADNRTFIITDQSVTDFLESNRKEDLFKEGPLLPQPNLDATGVFVNSSFVYAGGRNLPNENTTTDSDTTVTMSDQVATLSISNDTTPDGSWVVEPATLSEKRSFLASATVASGRFALFAGGMVEQEHHLVTKTIDIYDTQAREFKSQTPPLTLHIPRAATSAAVVNDCRVIFAGGFIMNFRNATATVDIFDMC